MNALTYGTLPKFRKFEIAMNNTFGSDEDDTVRFDFKLNAADGFAFAELGLIRADYFTLDSVDGTRLSGCCDANQLYALCSALLRIFEGEEGEQYMTFGNTTVDSADWAGDFCSSILTTLGFEWI